MAGRKDFAIVRSELLSDARADTAADLYVDAGIAQEDTALATVIGHVAMLGLWAMRETDNGVLPGDALRAMRFAIAAPRSVLEKIRNALTTAELLRKRRAGFYLVGFRSCYAPVVTKRKSDAERKRKARSSLEMSDGHPTDVQRTSERRPHVPNHTQPNHTQPPPPPDPTNGRGGGGGVGTSWWTAHRALAVDVCLAELRAGKGGRNNVEPARLMFTKRAANTMSPDEGKDVLDRWGEKFSREIAKAKGSAA